MPLSTVLMASGIEYRFLISAQQCSHILKNITTEEEVIGTISGHCPPLTIHCHSDRPDKTNHRISVHRICVTLGSQGTIDNAI
jgi:hypothetical protein